MHTPHQQARRRTALIAAACSFLLLFAASSPAAAHPADPGTAHGADKGAHTRPTPKPTVVLVHGAWADASGFEPVERRLRRAGYPVVAFANPLRSLQGDSTTLSAFLAQRVRGPVILVGHSYGGAVITNAATSDPDVEALVYLDAFAPARGESLASLIARSGPFDPSALFDFVPYAGGPAGDVDLYLKEAAFNTAFANGLPRSVQRHLFSTQRPLAASVFDAESDDPAWASIPSWYVLGTEDRIIPPALQRFMAERADAAITEVKAGHLSMIAKPRAVVTTIVRADRATD